MARARELYNLVGRYMNGNETVFYALLSTDTGMGRRVNETEMAWLVARGQVNNVTAQIYKESVLFRGKNGLEIASLPSTQMRGMADNSATAPTEKPEGYQMDSKYHVPGKGRRVLIMDEFTVYEGMNNYTPGYNKGVVKSPGNIQPTARKGQSSIEANPDDYDTRVAKMVKEYGNYAYRLEETTMFLDVEDPYRLIVAGKADKQVYCRIYKDAVGNVDDFYISDSTYELISYQYPELIMERTEPGYRFDKVKHVFYHELVIRLGLYSMIPVFKKAALLAKMYNEEIFHSEVPHKLKVCLGNYKDGTNFRDLLGANGYTNAYGDLIMLNASSWGMRSVDLDKPSRVVHTTLLHEMCHCVILVEKGTLLEPKREDWGDKVFGINSPRSAGQIQYHGRTFGQHISIVAQNTGFSFDELFGYGVDMDNHTKVTKYTKMTTSDIFTGVVNAAGIRDDYDTSSATSSKFNADYFNGVKDIVVKKEQQLAELIHKKTGLNISFAYDEDSIFVYAENNQYRVNTYEIKVGPYFADVFRIIGEKLLRVYGTKFGRNYSENYNAENLVKSMIKAVYIDLVQTA